MSIETTLYQDFTLSELESFLKGFQVVELRNTVDYYIPKTFGEQPESLQLQMLKQDMVEIIDLSVEKLRQKCAGFDFDQMKQDMEQCLDDWG